MSKQVSIFKSIEFNSMLPEQLRVCLLAGWQLGQLLHKQQLHPDWSICSTPFRWKSPAKTQQNITLMAKQILWIIEYLFFAFLLPLWEQTKTIFSNNIKCLFFIPTILIWTVFLRIWCFIDIFSKPTIKMEITLKIITCSFFY